jgi:hypothetical protein
MNVYKHILFSSKIVTASGIGFKKGKNVVESDHNTNFNMQRFILMPQEKSLHEKKDDMRTRKGKTFVQKACAAMIPGFF